ncbi:MAG: sigma-54 factor interaction domain-containing protein, partial [Lentisphaeria bacterium]|nr:sigma-54 factor interaction domain-containing protein [Lentisphaeria bacterium]
MPYDDLKPFIPQVSAKEMTSYHFLLEAAMYSHRNYQDEKSYGLAIKHLARKDPESAWSSSEKQLVEHYKRYGNRELVGKSAAMQKLQGQINMIAAHPDARVLIFGENGTGKETVALQIHNKSSRNREPFIAFNCASVTPNLLEDRFFGHEKGAFTGANEQRPGLFEQADGGTLFLDEIGELPLEAQG